MYAVKMPGGLLRILAVVPPEAEKYFEAKEVPGFPDDGKEYRIQANWQDETLYLEEVSPAVPEPSELDLLRVQVEEQQKIIDALTGGEVNG